MKKCHLVILMATVLLLALAGCNWQIPESISVKTNAVYNFSVGEFEKDFSDVLNSEELLSGTSNSIENIRIYDYFPGEADINSQKFLMKLPLLEIPVDFSLFFEASNIASQVEGLAFSKDIKIPNISISSTQTLDSSVISSVINSAMTFAGSGGGNVSFGIEFTSVTYSSGSLIINCAGLPNGMTVTISSNGVNRQGTFSNGSASIDISGFSIYKASTSISFSNQLAIPFVGTIASNSVISRASGVTIQTPVTVPVSTSIDLSSNNAVFESCVVSAGSLSTNLKVPKSWSNVIISYGLSASGGLNFTSDASLGSSHIVDLSGKVITPTSTSIECSISLTMVNATVDSSAIVMDLSSQILGFDSIDMNLNGLTTSVNAAENFSSVIYNTLRSVTLGTCGLTGKYTNTLPAGNDIELITSSSFLGIERNSCTLTSSTIDGELSILSSGSERTVKIKQNPSASDEYNSWDFLTEIHLPGYTSSNPSKIRIRGVAPGAVYTIGLEITPEVNWSKIVINTGNFSSIAGTHDLGFNLGNILSGFDDILGVDFASKVRLESLPVYLYANKPEFNRGVVDPFEQVGFYGTVRMFGGTNGIPSDADSIVNIVGDAANSQSAQITLKRLPTFEYKNSNTTVITNMARGDPSIAADLAHIANSSENGTLHIDYNLSFSNGDSSSDIEITPSMLSSTNTSSSLGVTAYIVLPLNFFTTDRIDINLFELMNQDMDHDLLGRDSQSSYDEIDKYLNVIRSASILYDSSKSLFYSNPPISLNVKFANTSIDEDYNLNKDTVMLNAGEIVEVLNVYPLIPSVNITIYKDTLFSITRYRGISMALALQLVTDGTIPLFGGE